jgi:hypothetical protein
VIVSTLSSFFAVLAASALEAGLSAKFAVVQAHRAIVPQPRAAASIAYVPSARTFIHRGYYFNRMDVKWRVAAIRLFVRKYM